VIVALRQIRALRATNINQISHLLARAVGRDLVGPFEQFGVNAVALDQPIDAVLTRTAALVALEAEHVELAHDVAKNNRILSRHHTPRYQRKTRSICAVADSIWDRLPVWAPFNVNSAAKSQCATPDASLSESR
jgi:hypothetical protein